MSHYKLFDGVICLSLDKRKEHWQELQQKFEDLGCEFYPFICGNGLDPELKYDQIDEINPDVSRWGYGHSHLKYHHYNAFLGHLGMVNKVKELGWKSVLFVEDDLELSPRFDIIMRGIEEREEELNYAKSFPVFYLSWWKGDEYDQYNNSIEDNWNHWGRIALTTIQPGTNIGGLHMVIFREEVYNKLLSLQPTNPIDSQLCHFRNDFPSLMLEPKASTVKSIVSMTEGCTFQRRKIER